MQHIPDNEFDRLFKDRFKEAEVQPSAELWNRIAPEIKPKKKHSVVLYWRIAATVLVALSAGLLFKPEERIALHAPIAATSEHGEAAMVVPPVTAGGTSEVLVERKELPAEQFSESSTAAAYHSETTNSAIERKTLVAMQPIVEEDHHHVVTTGSQPEIAVKPALEIAATEVALADDFNENITEPIVTEAAAVAEIEPPVRPKIRNAGDLVNFVVDKIDKREQKFVEFRTDEDESSSLVAINIGPIKINQKRNR